MTYIAIASNDYYDYRRISQDIKIENLQKFISEFRFNADNLLKVEHAYRTYEFIIEKNNTETNLKFQVQFEELNSSFSENVTHIITVDYSNL